MTALEVLPSSTSRASTPSTGVFKDAPDAPLRLPSAWRLNNLSGNPDPAQECLALDSDDFVAPGATFEEEIEEAGTQRFECCIHP